MEAVVQFEPQGCRVQVPAGTTLLEAARRAELPLASACGESGVCGRCGLEILEGAGSLADPSWRERDTKARNRVDSDLRLACLSEVWGDLVVTARYW